MRALLTAALLVTALSVPAIAEEGDWTLKQEYREAAGISECFIQHRHAPIFIGIQKLPGKLYKGATLLFPSYPGTVSYISIDGHRFQTTDKVFDFSKDGNEMMKLYMTAKTIAYEFWRAETKELVNGKVAVKDLPERLKTCSAWLLTQP